MILNLPFVNPKYIIDIYSKIKCEINTNGQFSKFLECCLKKNYLKNYKYWN